MYQFDENGLPVTKRRHRKDLTYLSVKPDKLDQYSDRYYAYCDLSQVMILCEYAEHWQAMQEHLYDYLEAIGFLDDYPGYVIMPYPLLDMSDEQIAEVDKFIMEHIKLWPVYNEGDLPTDQFQYCLKRHRAFLSK